MNYRELTRLFVMSYLTLWAILLTIIAFWGFHFLHTIILFFGSINPDLVVLGIFFPIFLSFCFVNVVANRRLMKATEEGALPNCAVNLTTLWWKLAWFLIVIGAIRFIFLTFSNHSQKHRAWKVWEGGEQVFNWKYFLDFAGLVIHSLALFCVYKFRNQMRSGIIHTATGYFLPMTAIVNPNREVENQRHESNYPYVPGPNLIYQNPQLPPPSYENVKYSEIYEPPPPYTSLNSNRV